MLYKMIYFLSHQFAFSNLRFCAILRTFSSITRKICVQIKNKVHVNQFIEPDLMMCIHKTFSKTNHSTYLFKIFFSLLTLSTTFLQKASGPEKIIVCSLYKYIHNKLNISFKSFLLTRSINVGGR